MRDIPDNAKELALSLIEEEGLYNSIERCEELEEEMKKKIEEFNSEIPEDLKQKLDEDDIALQHPDYNHKKLLTISRTQRTLHEMIHTKNLRIMSNLSNLQDVDPEDEDEVEPVREVLENQLEKGMELYDHLEQKLEEQ